jgi:hypothetical protein
MSTFIFRSITQDCLIPFLQIQWWLQVMLVMVVISVPAAIYLYYQALKTKRELLIAKDMLRVQLEIQDLTFSAISKEVHENVGQILSLVKVQLNLLSEGNDNKAHLLEEAKNNISIALEDLREIAKSLSNRKLISMGLISSLEHEADRLNDATNCNIRIKLEGNPLPITETQHLVIFRAVQYFLNRLTQENSTKKILLKLSFNENNWQVIIYHPGVEKDWSADSEKDFLNDHALVLRRLSIIGAKFTISTQIDTQIIINVPYA